jgi:hypothetical protein
MFVGNQADIKGMALVFWQLSEVAKSLGGSIRREL